MKKTIIIGAVGFVLAIGLFTGALVLFLPKPTPKPEMPAAAPAAAVPSQQSKQASEPVPPQQPPVKLAEAAPAPTDTAIKNDVFVATNEETFGMLNMKSEAQDQQYILKLLARKEVFVVAQGTKVQVSARDAAIAHIEVLEGDMKGRRGFVPIDSVK